MNWRWGHSGDPCAFRFPCLWRNLMKAAAAGFLCRVDWLRPSDVYGVNLNQIRALRLSDETGTQQHSGHQSAARGPSARVRLTPAFRRAYFLHLQGLAERMNSSVALNAGFVTRSVVTCHVSFEQQKVSSQWSQKPYSVSAQSTSHHTPCFLDLTRNLFPSGNSDACCGFYEATRGPAALATRSKLP
jgi:hypothetical protein